METAAQQSPAPDTEYKELTLFLGSTYILLRIFGNVAKISAETFRKLLDLVPGQVESILREVCIDEFDKEALLSLEDLWVGANRITLPFATPPLWMRRADELARLLKFYCSDFLRGVVRFDHLIAIDELLRPRDLHHANADSSAYALMAGFSAPDASPSVASRWSRTGGLTVVVNDTALDLISQDVKDLAQSVKPRIEEILQALVGLGTVTKTPNSDAN